MGDGHVNEKYNRASDTTEVGVAEKILQKQIQILKVLTKFQTLIRHWGYKSKRDALVLKDINILMLCWSVW